MSPPRWAFRTHFYALFVYTLGGEKSRTKAKPSTTVAWTTSVRKTAVQAYSRTFLHGENSGWKKPLPKTPHKKRRCVMPRVGTGAVTLPRRLVPCYFFPLLCRFNVIGPRSDYRGAKVRWIGFKTFAPPCSLFFRLFFFSSFPRASRRRFLIYLRSLPQIQNTSNKRECFFSGRSTSGLNRVTPWPSPSPPFLL